MSAQTATSDVLRSITDRIVAALKRGVRPWERPWRASGAPLRHVGLPFTGTNRLILSLAAGDNGYEGPYWLTKAQGGRYGASVNEGEEGTRVLRPIFVLRQTDSRTDPETGRAGPDIPLMQSYEVFNAEQFDRLPPRFRPEVDRADRIGFTDRIEAAERYFEATGARIEHGGGSATYNPAEDLIRMPRFEHFKAPERYYSTLAHEAIHWTGHESRMGRDMGGRFGDPRYAFEELVAELGATFLMDRLSLPCRVEHDHAPYIESWIRVLEHDERAIHHAAARAQRAADYLTIATVRHRVAELAARPLNHRPYIVVYLDVVEIGRHPLVVAVGVDSNGAKRLLGMRLASAEPPARGAAVEHLLCDLVQRGLSLHRRRLFVTDGSPLLRDRVVKVFGWDTVVQACRRHLQREILGRLPSRKDRDQAGAAFTEAWKRGADDGQRHLAVLADGLERDGHDAAARHLRERLDDLFTVDRFRLHPRLGRGLTTTALIDRARSELPRQVCGVPRWSDPEVALRWAAASFLASERGFQKLAGHRHIQFLKDHLAQIEMPFHPDAEPVAAGPASAQDDR